MREGQGAALQPGDPLLESAGCCGVLARAFGGGLLIIAVAALGILIVTGPSDRWQGIGDPNSHPLALVSDPQNLQTVYIGTEQGQFLVSHNGGQTWQESHEGLPLATPISALALLSRSGQQAAQQRGGGTELLAGTSKGVFRSSDGGATWHTAGPGIPFPTIVDAVSALSDGTLLAGATGTGVYALRSGSTTWQIASTGLPPHSDIYAFLPLTESGHVLAALISGGVYASHDDGMTWAESDRGLSTGSASGVNVFSFLRLARQQGGDSSILAGTSRGIYVSHDQGATWSASSVDVGTTRVISLARDPVIPTEVFAGTDTGVYASRDGGATWHALGFGLPADQHVGALGVVYPAGAGRVILASVDRLYRYPGDWPLAAEPWRALGFGVLGLLALILIGFIIWQARSLVPR